MRPDLLERILLTHKRPRTKAKNMHSSVLSTLAPYPPRIFLYSPSVRHKFEFSGLPRNNEFMRFVPQGET